MIHTTSDNTTTPDPAAIEQDIRRTQANMSRTVEKIGDQFTVRNIFNALLDKADENDVDARKLIDGARRNPVALGLIAAGAIWLVSDKDSKFPSLGSGESDNPGGEEFDNPDVHHRDYVSHMSAITIREHEDPVTYQHRRDIARANFMMIERGHEEDEHGFRQRLDDMTEKFRDKRRAWAQSSDRAGSAAKEKARRSAEKTRAFYESNPLVGGLLVAAVGAAFGSAIPTSRQEQEKLGSVGKKARDFASEKKDEVASRLHDEKDRVIEKVDHKIQQGSADGQSSTFQASSPAHREFSGT